MRENEFRDWLLHGYITRSGQQMNKSTIQSRIGNCKTIEMYEGDLDDHFRKDKCKSLKNKLRYTKNDEAKGTPSRHNIEINGSVYNGTATLRSALNLYIQFSEVWAIGHDRPKAFRQSSQGERRVNRVNRNHQIQQEWPIWESPSEDQILKLAQVSVPFLKFLHPDIVRAIVEDNEKKKERWGPLFERKEVRLEAYLWDKSACAFPGIRRYAGSKEIAFFRGHTSMDFDNNNRPLKLDDNDYPKQIWSFVFRGRKFPKHGPYGYALAHLADHKKYNNRYSEDFTVIETDVESRSLYGLYTSVANTIYTPHSLIKPTDFAGGFRNLLMRRAEQLYGGFCHLLPPWLKIPREQRAEWSVDSFDWSEPVGTLANIDQFIDFRNQTIDDLLND